MRLEEIPFITHVPRDGRGVLLQPWYDHDKGEWDMYFEARPGDFIRIEMIEYHSGIFYSHRQVVNSDFEMPLVGLVAQHLSFKGIPRLLFSLIDDFNMLCACLKKIAIFSSLEDDCSSSLIRSELDYLFSLVRAMYDILQTLVGKITRLLVPQDGGSCISQMPDSFAKIVLDGDTIRSPEELMRKYSLPLPLARFYHSRATIFRQVRSTRVAIEHHGKNIPDVFATENGPGIRTSGLPLWEEMAVWSMHDIQPNGIGSVQSLAAFLTDSCLDTCASLESALREVIDRNLLPPPIVADAKTFYRNPLAAELIGLEEMVRSPWRCR
jgi:hypothetical protein